MRVGRRPRGSPRVLPRARHHPPEHARSVPAADILGAQLALGQPRRSAWIWRPSVDGAALTSHPLTAIANGAAAGVPLLLQTCARECAYYQVLTGDAGQQADRVFAEYFRAEAREKLFAAYAADYRELDDIALRVAIMTDERYIVGTSRRADAQSVHAPVSAGGPGTTARTAGSSPTRGWRPIGSSCTARAAPTGWASSKAVTAWPRTCTTPGASSRRPATPAGSRYTAVSRRAMIFGQTGPYLADDPFAPAREAWGTLDWQPSAWWSDH